MSVNPALGLIGLAAIAFMIFTNKKLRNIAIIGFVFMFMLNIMLDHPEVVTKALDKTVKPVTGLWQKCQKQMDSGEKTCQLGN
jgi:C4-dicarboxylate transporter